MSRAPSLSRVGWFAPPLFLLAALAGGRIALARPATLFGILLALVVVLPALWILISALWPARAERRCPACSKLALARLDRRAAHGLCCRACGWRDESASTWLLAEEEGALEELVLAQRRRKTSAVDSAPRSG